MPSYEALSASESLSSPADGERAARTTRSNAIQNRVALVDEGVYPEKRSAGDVESEDVWESALMLFALGLLFGGVCAAICGLIIGIPALRLKGDYLAIITLGFAEIIRVVMLNIDSVLGFELTGGAKGLTGIPSYTNFLNTFIVVAIVIFLIHTMMKSRHDGGSHVVGVTFDACGDVERACSVKRESREGLCGKHPRNDAGRARA